MKIKPHHCGRAAPFPDHSHDHQACVIEAMTEAEALCKNKGLRLTPLRRQVLELVWASHQPIGAYTILEQLDRDRGTTAPPTVYRSLDFLVANGLVHRIDSLNAFVGCNRPHNDHAAYFLICDGCGDVAELTDPSLAKALQKAANGAGFKPRTETVEVSGLCQCCQNSPLEHQNNATTST